MLPLPIFPLWTDLIWGGLLAGCSVLLVFLVLKSENNTPATIGLAWDADSFRRVLLGTLCGMAVVGIMLLALVLFSSLTVVPLQDPDYWDAVGYAALLLFVLAFMEEVVFRSYPLVRLAASVGVRASIYITSVFFAFYHGLNPENLLGPGVWGLFFGLTAIKTNGIAFPTGFHFGLNWMQSFFGMKLQYASALWTLTPGESNGLVSVEFIGLGIQILLLLLGVVLIEVYVRRRSTLKQNGGNLVAARFD